jgi:hypothetical protein
MLIRRIGCPLKAKRKVIQIFDFAKLLILKCLTPVFFVSDNDQFRKIESDCWPYSFFEATTLSRIL